MIDLNTLQELSASALEERLALHGQEKVRAHRLAEEVFGSRGDVLQQPGPDPEEDRYLALLRLLMIAAQYGGKRDASLFQSDSCPGELVRGLFYCTHVSYHTCYDGGCHSDDSDYFGVNLWLARDLESALSLLSKGKMIKLDRPAGLSDYVLVEER